MFSAALVLAVTVDLHSELEKVLAERHLPAISATVTRSDGIVAHGVAGERIAGKPDVVRIDDAFHIGSCTKPVLATLAGILVDQKKLAWQTTIVDVFPEWKTAIRPDYARVTVAQLLAHETGLAAFDDTADFANVPPLTGSAIDRRREFARWVLSSVPPVAPPGTAFKYSNAGYSVMAAIIERVTGRSWDALARRLIFDPLAMKTAGAGWPAGVWGHIRNADGTLTPVDPKGSYQLPEVIAPAGDLHMSSDDLAAFLRAHLRAMRGDPSLITPVTATAIHTRHIRSGLGFGVNSVAGFENVATHSGSADTFVTVIAIAPAQDVAVAVSTNVAGPDVEKAVGAVLKDLLIRYARKAPETTQVPGKSEGR